MAGHAHRSPARSHGFEPDALQFLADLAENNERAWFQPRKADYERLIKEPFEALCVALADRFAARGLPLLADPARSPFRIYRDVRFSKDKSPYKTAQGAQFPWQGASADGPHAASGWAATSTSSRAASSSAAACGTRTRPSWPPSASGWTAIPASVLASHRGRALPRGLRLGHRRVAGAQSQGLPGRPPPRRAAAAQGRRLQPTPLRCRRLHARSCPTASPRTSMRLARCCDCSRPWPPARRRGVAARSVGRAVRRVRRSAAASRRPMASTSATSPSTCSRSLRGLMKQARMA